MDTKASRSLTKLRSNQAIFCSRGPRIVSQSLLHIVDDFCTWLTHKGSVRTPLAYQKIDELCFPLVVSQWRKQKFLRDLGLKSKTSL